MELSSGLFCESRLSSTTADNVPTKRVHALWGINSIMMCEMKANALQDAHGHPSEPKSLKIRKKNVNIVFARVFCPRALPAVLRECTKRSLHWYSVHNISRIVNEASASTHLLHGLFKNPSSLFPWRKILSTVQVLCTLRP